MASASQTENLLSGQDSGSTAPLAVSKSIKDYFTSIAKRPSHVNNIASGLKSSRSESDCSEIIVHLDGLSQTNKDSCEKDPTHLLENGKSTSSSDDDIIEIAAVVCKKKLYFEDNGLQKRSTEKSIEISNGISSLQEIPVMEREVNGIGSRKECHSGNNAFTYLMGAQKKKEEEQEVENYEEMIVELDSSFDDFKSLPKEKIKKGEKKNRHVYQYRLIMI